MLSNILVALAMTLPWLAPDTQLGAFFARPSVRTAIASYIIIVSVIYYAVLRKLWNPEGWQLVADTIEHCVTPSLFIALLPTGWPSCRGGGWPPARCHGG